MRSRIGWALGAALLAVLALSGCAEVSATKHTAVEPYTKEAVVGGDGLYRVKLAESAVKRLDLKTVLVREMRSNSGAILKVIPYGGLIYDLKGDTWTYTSPEPLHYVRERVHVDYIDGDSVFLLDGPKVDTPVVVSGAAELYGIEFGLGK